MTTLSGGVPAAAPPNPDPLDVDEDPMWRRGYDEGRFDGAWAQPVWRRIVVGVLLAFMVGVALGWYVAVHA